LAREVSTTESLKMIAGEAFKSMDFQTYGLMQEMSKEQIEEEALFVNLIDSLESKSLNQPLFSLEDLLSVEEEGIQIDIPIFNEGFD
jgi:ferritin